MRSDEEGKTESTLGDAEVWVHFQPDLHPCAIDAYHCSDAENGQSFFLCGQYELEEGTSGSGAASREGSIHICSVNSTTQSLSYSTTECKSGVLDMKVAGDYVASAQADHSLCIHQIQRQDAEKSSPNSFQLEEIVTVSEGGQGLFLSVDWDLGYYLYEIEPSGQEFGDRFSGSSEYSSKHFSEHSSGLGHMVRRRTVEASREANPNIAVSTQEGSLIVYEMSDERELSETFAVNGAHKLGGQPIPAWIVCFDPHSKTSLVSGGDDCIMKLWDLRQGTTPTSTNKSHNAGVTSAQWHPQQEHIFATGSYDEHLRVWDNRLLRDPVADIETGGGVWRTKWNIVSDKSSYLFLSCMQGGSAIVEYEHSTCKCELKVAHTDKSAHNHLAYGIDIIGAKSQRETSTKSVRPNVITATVASCSFYDNKVQIWDVSL